MIESVNLPQISDYLATELIHESERTLVYRGHKRKTGQPVVIKLMRNQYPTFRELVQFRNQYAITKNIEIEGILKPYALERYENRYALIMEDMGAGSLAQYQDKYCLSISQFLDIAIQLAEILHQLHQNQIIHKDIKPANILIHPQTQKIKLIDFSISTLLPKETQTIQTPNILEGTLAYLSPEQTGRMNRGIDYRSDFYSLGVTLYELLTGNLPFTSNDALELIHAHIAKMPAALGKRYLRTDTTEAIPQVLSDLVLKLIAKNAEDRYQSATGLKYDLEKCREQYRETGKIEPFVLAQRDICDRFLIPEKLYGREKEVQTLLDAFERVTVGKAEMLLVAGFSGIGKTAVVNEVHKPIVRQKGYFIKGKFDQFNRNIPFSAFVQAFRDFMRQLLRESDAELANWKAKILTVVGENGQVLIETIPELERIIGSQPPVPELSGTAAQNRFNLLFQKFISVFTTIEHPLVIFLDDLQWADSASLSLMKVLMEDSEIRYLLLLGAYRDNEVFPAHPLMLCLASLEKHSTAIVTMTLAPLSVNHINQLVAESLSCTVEIARALSDLVYQKTRGNPFFTTQFLKGLYEDELIVFNSNLGYWECDLVKVREAALTDDVVEFMAGRLHKLPTETQKVLKLAACIGNQFDLDTLAIVCESPSEEVAANLWTVLREGLILPLSEAYKFFQGWEKDNSIADSIAVGYRFLHDRVQQAAYSLIPEEQKQITHYRIGQRLLQQASPQTKEDQIFEIVNQLNYGTSLIAEQCEKDELAQLNLIACRKARAATAYQAGREYARIGLSLLGEKAWARQYEMTLAFYDLAVELAMLCGDIEAMECAIETIIKESRSALEKVNAYRTKIVSHISRNQLNEAIEIARYILQQLDLVLPETVKENDIQLAIAEIGKLIKEREIEDLLDLPNMSDGEKIAILEIVNSILPAVYISGSLLFPLLIALLVKLSIKYGNTSVSGGAYASYGLIACIKLEDINTGVKFSSLALQVTSKLDAKTVKPQVLNIVGSCTLHRKFHMRETLPLLQEGYTVGLEVGSLDYAGYNAHAFCLHALWCGFPLATLELDIRTYQQGVVQLNQLIPANWCRTYLQTTLNLLGSTKNPHLLSGEALEETEFLPQLISAVDEYGLYLFYLCKVMLCCLFEEIETARSYAVEVKRYFISGIGTVGEPVFYFYDSLSTLSALSRGLGEPSELLQQVAQNQTKLQQQWANYAPMNHQHKVDLVEAEKCRVLGQKLAAIELYDKAIAGAKENEYIQEEALANELAAKFYLNWGKEKIACTYMQEAYYCYASWGAKAKIEDLEQRYPSLLSPILKPQKLGLNPRALNSRATMASLSTGTISKTTTGTGELLDLATLMKASRTLSENIELEGAIANLMQIAKENAGAQTIALMLFEQQVLMLTAKVTGEELPVINPLPVETSSEVPLSIVNQVKRSQKPLILENASIEAALAGDVYIQNHQPRSILCLPLVARGQLIGILYLENNQVAGAFTTERFDALELLCSQAAIALENAQLYRRSQQYSQQLEQALVDLQNAQLQMIQSEKMSALGNLVSGVGHEMNNPLGFISATLQQAQPAISDIIEHLNIYQESLPNKSARILDHAVEIDLDYTLEDLPQMLDSMVIACDRLKNISTSLRTFSRADQEYKVPFNIHEGIDSTLLILKHRLKANQQRPAIAVVTKYGNIPEIDCFPGQLNQVFMNIIANAIDALDESSMGKSFAEIKLNPNQIMITTSVENESVKIGIYDNGHGMNEEVQTQIFDHLFTTKAVGKGTGLGLAIAQSIVVEKHNGTIAVNSRPGAGTEFIITLPITGG